MERDVIALAAINIKKQDLRSSHAFERRVKNYGAWAEVAIRGLHFGNRMKSGTGPR